MRQVCGQLQVQKLGGKVQVIYFSCVGTKNTAHDVARMNHDVFIAAGGKTHNSLNQTKTSL